MFVRYANINDAQRIASIHVETWRVAYRGQISDAVLNALNVEQRAAFWRERLTKATGSVLIVEDGELIGFCDLIPSRDGDADPKAICELAAIYVLSRYWRKGAGRALCKCALAEARRQGCQAVTLWVLACNDNAIRFYEAMGFTLDGARKVQDILDGSSLHEVRFRIAI